MDYIQTISTETDSLFGFDANILMLFTASFSAWPSVVHGMIKKQITITGKETNLTCQGKGNPRPTISWLKNGQKIVNSSRMTQSSSVSGDKLVTSELVISDTKYEDGGVYTCVINNMVGETKSSATLLVHGKLV